MYLKLYVKKKNKDVCYINYKLRIYNKNIVN